VAVQLKETLDNRAVGALLPSLTAIGAPLGSVTLAAGGTGWGANATGALTFTAPPTGGVSPAGTWTSDASGAIVSLTITSYGKGYLAVPTVGFTGAGSGATATAILGNPWQVTNINPVSGTRALTSTAAAPGAKNYAIFTGTGVGANQRIQIDQVIQRAASGAPFAFTLHDLVVRCNAAADTYYLADVDLNANKITLYRNVAGVVAQLAGGTSQATLPQAYANGAQVSFLLEATGTTIQAKIWTAGQAEPGAWTVSATDANIASGSPGVGMVFGSVNTVVGTPTIDNIFVGDAGTTFVLPTVTPTPAALPIQSAAQITVNVVGVNTAWSGGTVFNVVDMAPVTGISKASQVVTDATHAAIVLSLPPLGFPTGVGIITIDDGNSNVATVAIGVPALSVSPIAVNSGAPAALTLSATNTAWQHMLSGTGFSVSAGSLGAPSFTGDGGATVTFTPPSSPVSVIITDLSTGATTSLSVAVSPPGAPVLSLVGGYPSRVSFTAPTAGANPVGGLGFWVATAPGAQNYNALPLETSPGSGSGVIDLPPPPSGTTWYITARTYDSALTPTYSVPSNEVAITSPVTATALVISGPTSGVSGQASTPLTITPNGTLGGSTPVTLSDGGAGGTFTPATVTLTPTVPTASATYTAASAGLKTLAASAAGLASAAFQYASIGAQRYTQTFTATYGPSAAGLAATLGYVIRAGDGTILVPRTVGKMTEMGSGTGKYVVTVLLDASWSGAFVPDDAVGIVGVPREFDSPAAYNTAVPVTVGAYVAGQDPASLLLFDPTQKIDAPALHRGTARAGSLTTLTLALAASAVAQFYTGSLVRITGGAGVGQARYIADYNAVTQVATVREPWIIAPDGTSTYVVLGADRDVVGQLSQPLALGVVPPLGSPMEALVLMRSIAAGDRQISADGKTVTFLLADGTSPGVVLTFPNSVLSLPALPSSVTSNR
jgi:hypothetical protein